MKCWHCGIYDAHTPIGLCVKCNSVSSMLMSEQTKQRLEAQQAVCDAATAIKPALGSNPSVGLTGESWVYVRADKLKTMQDALDALGKPDKPILTTERKCR